MYPGCRQVLALSRLSTDPATEFGPRRGEGRTSLAQGMKQRLTSADLGRTDALAQKHSQGDRACLQAEPSTRRRAGSWEELLGRKASATGQARARRPCPALWHSQERLSHENRVLEGIVGVICGIKGAK